MLGDITAADELYIVTGYTDMRKLMILASPGQHSCNTRTHIPTTFGQAFLYYPDIHS